MGNKKNQKVKSKKTKDQDQVDQDQEDQEKKIFFEDFACYTSGKGS